MLFLSALAALACAAAIDHRAHTCLIAHLESGDILSNYRNYAGYFVTGNLRILLRPPFTFELVDV